MDRRNDTHTHTHTQSRAIRCVISALLLFSCGCDGLISPAANDRENVSVTAVHGGEAMVLTGEPPDAIEHLRGLPMIDAGVVLSDHPFYLCIPLSRIGLRSDDEIVSLHSSCECIRLQLVKFYENSNQTNSPAILLENVIGDSADERKPVTVVTPASLQINVDAKLSDGRTHRFIVKLVESKLVNDIERRGADVDG